MADLYAEIVEWPAQRFYVSEERACSVIKRMQRGIGFLAGMHPLKRMMFVEINRRVAVLQKSQPGRSVRSLCRKVVMQPAPRFYLTSSSAKAILNGYRKKFKEL